MADPIPSLEADPCARAIALKAKRDVLVGGDGVSEYDAEHGNGVRRRVRYSAADLARLDGDIRAADRACALKSGKRPARFAATPRGGGW